MKNLTAKTLKGFRDFLPQEAIKRQNLITKLIQIFTLYGFDPLETPALEYLTIFENQIGEDEKLFYKFQDPGKRWVALRYDQTVPTCRLVAQNLSKLSFPFRRYQIQPVWRAEKPQKGRYREFLQCDADIFGFPGPEADAELIALSLDIYRQLDFPKAVALINDRSLYGNTPYPVIASLDKLEKIGRQAVIEEIVSKGFTKQKAQNFLDKIARQKPNQTIKTIFSYLKNAGFPSSWFRFEPTLARSFSYSTGPIWEIRIPEFGDSSVLGGERYDQLVSSFSNQKIPATGFALGFDRTLEAAEKLNLLKSPATNTKVLVTVFSSASLPDSLKIGKLLRQAKINTEIWPDPNTKIGKQLSYASAKKIPYAVILGPDEIKTKTVQLKNLAQKTQTALSQNQLASKIL